MGNAVTAAIAARVQAELNAQMASIKMPIPANGFIVSTLFTIVEEKLSRVGILEDNKKNRAAAAAAGVKWESFRFAGRQGFAKAHDKFVDAKTKKATWVYNPANAAAAIREYEDVKAVYDALKVLNDQLASKLK